ncbi:hypothetical protein GKZ90_0021285 [Flavobacterium sp. MC2016-06]|jgi:hypothetical protein|uniref:hypothetical protein n=1 Tax=Flavobacterium sp. MC2016-06 TaxID=2676308 RepID=UPI0012BB1246|nr:hypothetical protein [Flavobacterium sp. MC2016-06]MBU3861035.1 hypothetical protein [Flavobacterium sp. MC2016-06]
MKFLKSISFLLILLLISCNDQPTKLSNKQETIEVSYVNWACDCANFIERKYYISNTNYEIKSEDCIFIEPLNNNVKIPDSYYNTMHFEYYLKLCGQFYKDKGVPKSYEQKTDNEPEKAKVFRYSNFKIIKR